MGYKTSFLVGALLGGSAVYLKDIVPVPTGDLLKGFTESKMIQMPMLQVAITGFCMNSNALEAVSHLDDAPSASGHNFDDHGDIDNEDYTKQSIYALLYSMYAGVGKVDWNGIVYQFTFNTWGIGGDIPTAYPASDPQRHGKAAYHGLVDFPAVHRYLKEVTDSPKIVEVGCGTGAGANLISGSILTKSDYHAIDMQKAAYETCKELHAKHNPNLTCIHTNGKVLPFEDNSVDIVLISETHITDIDLDEESKKILKEVKRILKPNGLFVWGNALPTTVWNEAIDWLPTIGFESLHSNNVTKAAVVARDEDEDRVNHFCDAAFDRFFVLRYAKTCRHVLDRLLKNFYRHPGTALYDRMVTGYDSYMHLCHRKTV